MNDIKYSEFNLSPNSVIVFKNKLDENGEYIYDAETMHNIVQDFSEHFPQNDVLFLPDVEVSIWSREELIKYLEEVVTMLKGADDEGD